VASRSLARTARRIEQQIAAARELITISLRPDGDDLCAQALAILGDAQARAGRLARGARKPSPFSHSATPGTSDAEDHHPLNP
jgi:cell division septum initiation protein DivIVA